MTEKTIPPEDARIGDFVRLNYHGELRDHQITGWRHRPSPEEPLAMLHLFAGVSEYPPSRLKAGSRLTKGVTVARVWRWAHEPAAAPVKAARKKKAAT